MKFDHIGHDFIDGQRYAFCRKQLPVYETKSFYFPFFLVYGQLGCVKIEGLVAQGRGDGLQRFGKIIDGNDLMVGIKGAHLEIVGGIDMIANRYLQVHLFHKLALQAVAGAFAKLEPAAGKLGIIITADVFITYQYLPFIVQQNTVYP